MSEAKERLLIWGTGGHALIVASLAHLSARYKLVGFLADGETGPCGDQLGCAPVLGGAETLPALLQAGIGCATVAVGDCLSRLRIAALLEAAGFTLVTLAHPSAVLDPAALVGAGSVICAGGIVCARATLGANVIVNTGATVDHECHIADGVHIGPGAHLGGKVSVGRGTWLGIGAIVKDRVTIGAGSVVGAGALVLRDIPDNVMAYGVPARIVRQLTP